MTSLQDELEPMAAAVRVILEIAQNGTGDGAAIAQNAHGCFATPEQGLVADASLVDGRAAIVSELERLAPCRVRITGQASTGRSWWAELSRTAEGAEETCVIGSELDESGAVSRLLWFRAPAVPGLGRTFGGAPCDHDARPLTERYFAALADSRFGEAAEAFSDDCVYSHPPYRGGPERVLFRGREGLLDGFVNQRGESPARAEVQTIVQGDRWAFTEGVIEGIPNGGTFISSAQLDNSGTIARYVAFYTAARIR
jgi:SnoaL-like domain